jgi:hypothetical protein
MCPRGDQFGGPEQFQAHLVMGVGKEFGVLPPLGQSEQLLGQRPSPAQIPTNQISISQPIERPEMRRCGAVMRQEFGLGRHSLRKFSLDGY